MRNQAFATTLLRRWRATRPAAPIPNRIIMPGSGTSVPLLLVVLPFEDVPFDDVPPEVEVLVDVLPEVCCSMSKCYPTCWSTNCW